MSTFWILLTVISLIFSALFSGVEIAFITADRVRIGLDRSRGGLINRIVGLYYSHQEFFISTILVATTSCWSSMAWAPPRCSSRG